MERAIPLKGPETGRFFGAYHIWMLIGAQYTIEFDFWGYFSWICPYIYTCTYVSTKKYICKFIDKPTCSSGHHTFIKAVGQPSQFISRYVHVCNYIHKTLNAYINNVWCTCTYVHIYFMSIVPILCKNLG